jgi:hypothetical protein
MLILESEDAELKSNAESGRLPMKAANGMSNTTEDCRITCTRRPEMGRPEVIHLFADLVAMAGWLHPIPFRTRP